MFKLALVSALVALAAASPMIRHPNRIVGGEPVEIEVVPYQLSLQYYGSHVCGASIISKNFVVTAAHCTNLSPPSTLTVRAGSAIKNSGGQVVQVKTVYQNPQFGINSLDYDISVLELSESLIFGAGAQPVGLPRLNQEIPAGSDAVVSGWGALGIGTLFPFHLEAVHVGIISQEECRKSYDQASITDRMICAGVNGGGKDACQGDSGGPLVVDGQLVGIVSWGYGCGSPVYPGVYSSVSNLRDFITENAGI